MGSKRSLSVVDLLTLQPLWSIADRHFGGFSVATSRLQSRSSGGWIAVCCRDDQGSVSLEVFNPTSSDPVEAVPLGEKVGSVVFCRGGKLIMVTSTTGQILICRDSDADRGSDDGVVVKSRGDNDRRPPRSLPTISPSFFSIATTTTASDGDKDSIPTPFTTSTSSSTSRRRPKDAVWAPTIDFFSAFLRPPPPPSSSSSHPLEVRPMQQQLVSAEEEVGRPMVDLFPFILTR